MVVRPPRNRDSSSLTLSLLPCFTSGLLQVMPARAGRS
jgi:hypothetical protein